MRAKADEVLVLFLGQVRREHLDRKGFDLFGLGELLVDEVELALLRHSISPARGKVCDEEAPWMWSLGRLVLVVVMQSLEELRGQLRCQVENPAVTGSSSERLDLVIVAPSDSLENATPLWNRCREGPPSCASWPCPWRRRTT